MAAPETAEAWYAQQDRWHDEVAALRAVALGAGLAETVKWRHPCYTDQGRNILIVGVRKDHAVVSFVKGALLDDPRQRLVQPGIERSGRYVPYTSVAQVDDERAYLEALVRQAVQVERAGLRVEPLPDEIDYVDELQERLDADEAFREAFEGLTVGRRRQYNLHVGGAKQASTRVARLERCTERILMGKGLRDCICGKSRRYPQCDGSHRERS